MLGITLNITGLIFIILSLLYIVKLERKEINDSEDLANSYDEIKENSLKSDKKIKEIYKILDDKSNEFQLNSESMEKDSNSYKKDVLIELEDENLESNELFNKIKDLKNIGLTNEEIAKKLNKGVREIEIIFNLYKSL